MSRHDEDFDEHERFLIGEIQKIQEAYQLAAKPYVDRLLALRSLRPTPPMLITAEEAKAFGLIPDAAIPASNKEQA